MGANAVNTVRGTRKKVLTMAEYIERKDAVDAVLDVYYDTPDIDLSGEKFEDAILKIPAADVAPVVHGRWIHYPDCGVTRCSHCGWSIEECWESKRCPECGARMKNGC